jgi:hypothetical protein
MIGRGAMRATISGVSTPGPDRPRKRSAPSITSARVRGWSPWAYSAFCAVISFRGHGGQGPPDRRARRFRADAQLQQHVEAGDPRRPAAGGDDLDPVEPLARHMQRIGGRSADDDGGAVLVVVEDGDVHALAAQLFDDEAVGGLDVFQVDGAEGGFQRADDLGQLHGVGFVQLDVETVDIGEFLEEDGLAFHHRLGRQRADIAKAQHGGAVGDHGHKVAARGVAAGGGGVGLDLEAGFGHAGGIGAAQVAAIGQGLGRADLQLSGLGEFVVIQRRLPRVVLRASSMLTPSSIWFNVKPFIFPFRPLSAKGFRANLQIPVGGRTVAANHPPRAS